MHTARKPQVRAFQHAYTQINPSRYGGDIRASKKAGQKKGQKAQMKLRNKANT